MGGSVFFLLFFFLGGGGKHVQLWNKHHNLVVPKLKEYTPFWMTYSEKHPFLHHFIPGFCEKFSLFSHFCRFWYPNWVTHPAPKKVPFHLDFGRTCFSTQECHPPPPGSEQYTHLIIICLKHALFWLTQVWKHYKRVQKPLNVQGINLFSCVYGSRMIKVMLYTSIFAFYLSYHLYSIESK